MVSMKSMVRSLGHRVGVDVTRWRPDQLYGDFDEQLVKTIRSVEAFTMTSPERIEALVRAVRWIVQAGVPGDVVECGVWRGGSMMAAAQTLLEEGDTARHLWLFDTFEGMPQPGSHDRRFNAQTPHEILADQIGPHATMSDWCRAGLQEVQRNFARVGYPADRAHFVVGMVEETIPAQAPDTIALLRLDTDWYESTRHELEHLYQRVAPGGIVIIDDYGTWTGARKAVDEFMSSLPRPVLMHRIDMTGRLMQVH